jgi:hypothetical protein
VSRASRGFAAIVVAVALASLSGCSAVQTLKQSAHAVGNRIENQIVVSDLTETMTTLEKVEAENGNITGVTTALLLKQGYMSSRDDLRFQLKTSTDVDFCLQATSPTDTTVKDHFNGAADGGVAEGACVEGIDYD